MTFARSCIAFEPLAFCVCSPLFACFLVVFTKAPVASAQRSDNCTLFARLSDVYPKGDLLCVAEVQLTYQN
eukprot:1279514-Pleurochrysis_carterae.AAC.1